LKLFIWEGNGISKAYHDDGTLVVLANDVDEARRIMREGRVANAARDKEWLQKRDATLARLRPGDLQAFWASPEGIVLWDEMNDPEDLHWWDGKDESLDREPTRVVEIDKPKWVAFNGGGYD